MVQDDSYRRLADALEPILATERPDVLCERIVAGAGQLLPHDSLRVYEADAAVGELVPRAVRHPRFAEAILRARIPLGSGLNGWSASQREPVLAPQAQHHPRSLFIPGTPRVAEALMTVPLVARGGLVGQLTVQRYGESSDLFSEAQFELACRFGALTAVAFDNARQRSEIERLSRTDELTGLANRRGLQEELDRAVALAQRHGHALALLLIDLDHFKRINDCFGHRAGDAVLRRVGRMLAERLRTGDVAARLGGDEFVVVLPLTDADGAAVVAAEVKRALAEARIPAGGGTARVSASVGFAQRVDHESSEALLARADLLMYRAKRRQRRWLAPPS